MNSKLNDFNEMNYRGEDNFCAAVLYFERYIGKTSSKTIKQ